MTLWVASAIRLEASLSFLGIGTQPPNPSWGNIIRDGLNNLFGSPWPIIGAGFAITCVVLAFNLFGDAVRDVLDPETCAMTHRCSRSTTLPSSSAPRRNPIRVVDGVSFEVDAGGSVGIVGESGSGKSMTSLSILRLIPEPPGRIVAGGSSSTASTCSTCRAARCPRSAAATSP